MQLNRRGFFKVSGSVVAGSILGIGLEAAEAEAALPLAIQYARETTTICPYCAVGCGLIVHSRGDEVINTEGDPDHPINRGTLCSKGAAVFQLRDNKQRITEPMYRAKGSREWQKVSWDWALDQIADRVKATRDASFREQNAKGQVVNRTDAIASVGSAALDNEECYLLQKMLRSWGLVYIEHQARI
ncbi:formate dehydrogenase subunit alpha [Desulfuromonas soudanensis]|nr:formate dehydrogenase subunit alpha [Desulfuromonas soudanensis]